MAERANASEFSVWAVAVVGTETQSDAREITVVAGCIVACAQKDIVGEDTTLSLHNRLRISGSVVEIVAIQGTVAHLGRGDTLKTVGACVGLVLILQVGFPRR